MILRRVLMVVAPAAAIATAAAIAVVSLAFAIFGYLRPWVGAANASAILAVVFALVVVVTILLAARRAGGAGRGRMDEREAMGLVDRLMELARDRPIAAVGVALALGVVLMRSPSSLSAIARAFFDSFGGGRSESR